MIAGTEFSEIMFEADWVMKQLSLGIEVLQIDPLKQRVMQLHQKLKNLGMKPSGEFCEPTKSSVGKEEGDWSRQWLVIKKIKMKKLQGSQASHRLFEIGDIKVGVEARQMERDKDGILRDKVVQDPNHRAYKFAQKFTEIYDEIA